MGLRALILGAAAGGGLPQWNCNGANSATFWGRGDAMAPATQSSLAVSVDGETWAVLNASPDIRAQIIATPQLHPRNPDRHGLRDSPIGAVLLTNGDIDHIAGLLTLREKQRFELFATPAIAQVLRDNPIFDALDPDCVTRREVALDAPFPILPGLTAELFAVPGKTPLFMEGSDGDAVRTDVMGEQTVGVVLEGGGRRCFYIPGCAKMTPALADRLRGAEVVFFDGTVFHDDEMIRAGVGRKTGRRMGHIAMAGPEGSLAAFADLGVRRKIYVHMNNTNPVWRRDSPERGEVEAAGWEVGFDGMEVTP
jgi:pyrroloquinoline quinone biosynthesis protein B